MLKLHNLFLVCLLAICICSLRARALRGLKENSDNEPNDGNDLEFLVIPTTSPVKVAAPTPGVSYQPSVAAKSETSESLTPTVSQDSVQPTLMAKSETPSVTPSEAEQTDIFSSARPTLAKVETPTTGSDAEPVSSQPTVSVTQPETPIVVDTNAPSVVKTDTPVVAQTDAPVAVITETPTVAETVALTNKPTVAKSDAPTTEPTQTETPTVNPTEESANVPVPVPVVSTKAPVVELTEAPTVAKTESPTVPTGTNTDKDSGSSAAPSVPVETETDTEEPEDLSNSTTTFVLVVLIGLVGFVLYRMYCKPSSSGALAPGESAISGTSYARLAQTEQPGDDFDPLGDIEMHGGAAFDDNAEIWEEWETNEEVNPPSVLQYNNTSTSASALPKKNTSNNNLAPSTSRSSSQEDNALSAHSRSTSNGGFNTLPPAPSPLPTIPSIPAPLSGGNLAGSLGTLGLNKSKSTSSGGLNGGGSSKKRGSGLTPPAEVDLFAVSEFVVTGLIIVLFSALLWLQKVIVAQIHCFF